MIYMPCRSYLPETYHLPCPERTTAQLSSKDLIMIYSRSYLPEGPIIRRARKERQPSIRKDLICPGV